MNTMIDRVPLRDNPQLFGYRHRRYPARSCCGSAVAGSRSARAERLVKMIGGKRYYTLQHTYRRQRIHGVRCLRATIWATSRSSFWATRETMQWDTGSAGASAHDILAYRVAGYATRAGRG